MNGIKEACVETIYISLLKYNLSPDSIRGRLKLLKESVNCNED